MSQKQTFDRFVLFPTPFTPTKAIVYGSRCWVEGKGEVSFVLIDNSISVEVLGVRMRVREVESARRTAALVAESGGKDGVILPQVMGQDNQHTLKAAHFLADKTFSHPFTNFLRCIFRDVLLH